MGHGKIQGDMLVKNTLNKINGNRLISLFSIPKSHIQIEQIDNEVLAIKLLDFKLTSLYI